MMKGKPQTLVSKFKISYNLLLNLMDTGHTDFTAFAKKSMIQETVDQQSKELFQRISSLTADLQKMDDGMDHLRTPVEIVTEYIDLNRQRPTAINKRRKEIERRLETLKDQYKYISTDESTVLKYNEKRKELDRFTDQLDYVDKDIDRNVGLILEVLKEKSFITDSKNQVTLTLKGKIATNLREIHCLVFTDLYGSLKQLSTSQLISVFSCFTNITVSEDVKSNRPETTEIGVKEILHNVQEQYGWYQDIETQKSLNTGVDYHIHFDLLGYVDKWAKCENVEECKYLLQTMAKEKEIFLGEFVKALLKINNISAEMERIAEMMGDMEFLSKLREIPGLTLKYVVTNQSLYL